jgi:16S rRNA (guanine527-N7)-methyltransferase
VADAEILDDEGAARDWLARAFAPSAARLERFAAMLVAENEQQNLIAASTIPILWVRHIADSAQLLALDAGGEGLWIDLGSGPGLPGLVVAILSERPMLLVESRKRRCDFLRAVVAELGLAHVEIAEAPLEHDQRAGIRAARQAHRLIRAFFHRIDALAAAKGTKCGKGTGVAAADMAESVSRGT